MANTPKAFIFIGRSGCGKGTQADLLMTHLCKIGDKNCKTLHIESGAFLRDFIKGDSYTQKMCREGMDNGKIMPEMVIVSLWSRFLMENFTGTENIIFDGCPRKVHEAQILDSAFKFYGIKKLVLVYMNVSEEWSKKRLIARARKDDTPDVIARRLSWFETEVVPTIEWYKSNSDYLCLDINGEQPIDDVQNEILSKLGSVLD